jgi:hypothetical protein
VKLLWGILCSKSLIDRSTNNTSLLEIIERLDAELRPGTAVPPGGAVLPLQSEFVTTWKRDNLSQGETGKGRFTIVDPGGVQLGKFDFDVDLQTTPRTRVITQLGGIKVTVSGEYTFETSLQGSSGSWTMVGTLPLEVNIK